MIKKSKDKESTSLRQTKLDQWLSNAQNHLSRWFCAKSIFALEVCNKTNTRIWECMNIGEEWFTTWECTFARNQSPGTNVSFFASSNRRKSRANDWEIVFALSCFHEICIILITRNNILSSPKCNWGENYEDHSGRIEFQFDGFSDATTLFWNGFF